MRPCAAAIPVLLGLVLALDLAIPGEAGAQTVDYAAAEAMFGEPVTNSATGQPQRVSEAPADMDIVTADQIRQSGADTIPDVLRFVAGIDVRQYGQQDAAVGIRGFNTAVNPRVLVLLDGRQVYEDDYGVTVWSLIPVTLSSIRQIEIIKGPSAALYGFNAVSGVINIVTYDPLRDRVNALGVDGGSRHQLHGDAAATLNARGRFGFRLSAQGLRSGEFAGGQAGSDKESPRSAMVSADSRMLIARNVEWDVSASLSSVDSDYYDIGNYVPMSFRANSLRNRLAADTAIGLLSLDVYRNENRTVYRDPVQYLAWREDVTVAQASDLLTIGASQTLRLAAEYRNNGVSSLQAFSGRVGDDVAAGSVMWNWKILPFLSMTNAFRGDDFLLNHHGAQFDIPGQGGLFRDARLFEPSFNSGVVLRLSPRDTIRMSVARAAQLPSLLDLGLAANFDHVIVAGNPLLRPPEIMNYELDYDRILAVPDGRFRVAAFGQRSDRSIGIAGSVGYRQLPDGQLLASAGSLGGSDEAGGEIQVRVRDRYGVHWNFGYALALVQDQTPKAILEAGPTVSYQRQTPVHAVSLGAVTEWHRLEAGIQARWQSHFEDFASAGPGSLIVRPDVVAGYVTVSARAAYRLTDQVTLSLAAQQLLGSRLRESAGLYVDRRLIAGITGHF